jgi:hypothetical protein
LTKPALAAEGDFQAANLKAYANGDAVYVENDVAGNGITVNAELTQFADGADFNAVTSPGGYGFVRESQGGRSTVAFDDRVAAAATGQAGVRMAAITRALGSDPHTGSVPADADRRLAKPRILSPMPPLPDH